MASVTATQTPSKSAKAYYAILDETNGALTKVHGTLYFVADDDSVTEVQPTMINFLVTLGEMTLSDAQHCADVVAGGPAAICTARTMQAA